MLLAKSRFQLGRKSQHGCHPDRRTLLICVFKWVADRHVYTLNILLPSNFLCRLLSFQRPIVVSNHRNGHMRLKLAHFPGLFKELQLCREILIVKRITLLKIKSAHMGTSLVLEHLAFFP